MPTLLDSLPSLRETVENHGLLAKKALGQNFLLDRNITDKIIRLSLEKQNKKDFGGEYVFEVGPGPGGDPLRLRGTAAKTYRCRNG